MILFYFTRCQLLQESWKLLTYNWLQTKWQLTLYAVCVVSGHALARLSNWDQRMCLCSPCDPIDMNGTACTEHLSIPCRRRQPFVLVYGYIRLCERSLTGRECHQHTMDHTVGPKALFNDHIVTANSNASEPCRTPSSGMWWGLTGAQDSCKQYIN